MFQLFGNALSQVLVVSVLVGAGLPALHAPLPPEALYDWPRMTAALAAERPWWPPGEAHGYAPITYGWLLGELLRRVDGRGPGESIAARIARPLGLDFHVGLADDQFQRVAHIARKKGDMGDATAQRLLRCMMNEPAALSTTQVTCRFLIRWYIHDPFESRPGRRSAAG